MVVTRGKNIPKEFIVVFVTAKDAAEAEKIAQGLLEQKLIACANIVPAVKSFFWWEGKVDQSDETLLIMKTHKKMFGQLAKTVKLLHSYSVPEIIALPIIAGSDAYLNWVRESTFGLRPKR